MKISFKINKEKPHIKDLPKLIPFFVWGILAYAIPIPFAIVFGVIVIAFVLTDINIIIKK